MISSVQMYCVLRGDVIQGQRGTIGHVPRNNVHEKRSQRSPDPRPISPSRNILKIEGWQFSCQLKITLETFAAQKSPRVVSFLPFPFRREAIGNGSGNERNLEHPLISQRYGSGEQS